MTVAVVTPWVEHLELRPGYLGAIDAARPDEVHIVDNGSSSSLGFATIRNTTNLGFTKACNQGLAAAGADIVVFLNNDIEMTSADWLDGIREHTVPGVLTGARLRRDAHGSVDGHEFPYLDGWCLAGMREDLVALGGFDESFEEPAYYSDNDLCLRARIDGMTLKQVDVGLVHLENRTAGPGTKPSVLAATRANYRLFAERAREALRVAA